MEKIISLVESAFSAKRQHGPNSNEFRAAQLAVYDEIDLVCEFGDIKVLTANSPILGDGISVEIRKKAVAKPGKPSDYCSYVLVQTKTDTDTPQ